MRRFRQLVMLIGIPIALSSCGVAPPPSRDQRNEQSRPIVLTTFTVLADMARRVAGSRLSVRSITKTGAEIHGYEPTPSDVEGAVGASLILKNGLGLELWADRFVRAAGNVPTVTLSDGIQPVLITEDAYAGRPNPHAWMSPKRAQLYVDRMVEAFSELDPAGQAVYRANGARYKEQLTTLDQQLRSAISQVPKRRRVLVTCEGAFSYLAQDYGLEEAYLWPVNAESQITPRRLARLIDRVRSSRVPAVFCESTVSDKAQQEVARATGARFGGTFFVDSLSGPTGPASSLIDLQRHNVGLIVKGLGGEVAER